MTAIIDSVVGEGIGRGGPEPLKIGGITLNATAVPNAMPINTLHYKCMVHCPRKTRHAFDFSKLMR